MTQEDFAQKVELTQTHISKYELGKAKVTLNYLLKLEELFRVNKQWILTGQLPVFNYQKEKKKNTLLTTIEISEKINQLEIANQILQANVDQLYRILEKKDPKKHTKN